MMEHLRLRTTVGTRRSLKGRVPREAIHRLGSRSARLRVCPSGRRLRRGVQWWWEPLSWPVGGMPQRGAAHCVCGRENVSFRSVARSCMSVRRVCQAPGMEMTLQLTIDCTDVQRLVVFWSEALGYVPEPPPGGHATWREYWAATGCPRRSCLSVRAIPRSRSSIPQDEGRACGSSRSRNSRPARTGYTSI